MHIDRKCIATVSAAGVAASALVLANLTTASSAQHDLSPAAAPAGSSSAATSKDGLVTLTTRTNSPGADPVAFRVEVRIGAIARQNNAEVGNLDWSALVRITHPGSPHSSIYSVFNDSAWQPVSFENAPPFTYTATARVNVDGFKGHFYISSIYHSPAVAAGNPAIAGNAKVGVKLTAKPGIWTAGTKLSYHWQANGKPIAKATNPAYTPVAANVGKKITVKVTGAKSNHKVSKASAATKPVAKGTLKVAIPAISGIAKVGRTLTAKPGNWTAGTKFGYHWLANGKAIARARAKTLKLTKALRGKKIRVQVTGKKAGYVTVTKISKPTSPIRK